MFTPTSIETTLEGQRHLVGKEMVADKTELRIAKLTDSYLVLVATSSDGWSRLFRDPIDGRLWEHSFPVSEMHGGGSSKLVVIAREAANIRYGTAVKV